MGVELVSDFSNNRPHKVALPSSYCEEAKSPKELVEGIGEEMQHGVRERQEMILTTIKSSFPVQRKLFSLINRYFFNQMSSKSSWYLQAKAHDQNVLNYILMPSSHTTIWLY